MNIMVRRIVNITLMIVATTFCFGCSNYADEVVVPSLTQAITFDVAIDDSSNSISRAALSSSSDLNFTSFKVYAVEDDATGGSTLLDGATVSKSGTSWSYSSTAQWPESNKVNFFAVAPSTEALTDATGDVDGISFKYTVPKDNSSQVDLMVDAQSCSYSDTNETGVVAVGFEHALSAISFSISGDINSSVTSISVSNIYESATFTATSDGEFGWSSFEKGTTEFAPTLSSDLSPNSDGSACSIIADDGYLIMLPQTLPYNSQIEVKIVTDMSGGSADESLWEHTTKYIPLSGVTWEAGYIYTYNIKVENGEIDFELSINPWGSQSIYVDESNLLTLPAISYIDLDVYNTLEALKTTLEERVTAGVTDFVVEGIYVDGIFDFESTSTDSSVSLFADYEITSLDLSGVEAGTEVELPAYAFYNFETLESITLPESIIAVGVAAFEKCSNLTEISLPKATTIGDNAFFDCTSLKTVSLPKATTIGGYVFNSIASGADIYLTSEEEIVMEVGTTASTIYADYNLYLNEIKGTDGYEGADTYSGSGNVWNGYTWKSISIESSDE